MLFTNIKQFQSQFEAKKETDPQLSNDIMLVKQDTLEPLDMDEWEIDQIIDVIIDKDKIKKIEESLGGSNISTDLTVTNVKVGSVLYLTALLKPRNKSTAYPIGEMGCIQVKVMNVFYGLNKLNQMSKAGKLLK